MEAIILFVFGLISIWMGNVPDKKIIADSPTRLFFAELETFFRDVETSEQKQRVTPK
ncbi:hypothetical protein NG800_002130 [Epilithonimonas ginsengisoli]|uniref:Uncharacterized protein n=1 Tax=Epilithonimonas ginsengisoli TaxID=1245592 RepID=A0ABU4JDE8_9FLAO|nr:MULTISPECIES: hypothetical protein [Chryseobacterium group]MBV6878665.1 hypothetical protein [Epilithonimonas sp. FP105]MDW8547690.1 hypothetical protein [Epilithonimonas ginsengisoli]